MIKVVLLDGFLFLIFIAGISLAIMSIVSIVGGRKKKDVRSSKVGNNTIIRK